MLLVEKLSDNQYWIDSSKIKKHLGWEPRISLKDGIIETGEWVKNNFDELIKEPMTFTLRAFNFFISMITIINW